MSPLEHPGPSASHPALVHLRKKSVSISLDAIIPSVVKVSGWIPPPEPVFQRQSCCLSFLQQPWSQHRLTVLSFPPASTGVAPLWALSTSVCNWVWLDFGSQAPQVLQWSLMLPWGCSCPALPGQTVLVCLAQVELQCSLAFPPQQSVRWIRDDLPLVNYITVNVSYITAAPPKIMAKILLTF